MNFQLLKKTGGSRFKEFHTIKVCKNNQLRGKQSLKDSREAGMDDDNFVHVIKSVLDTYDKPVVVKIMDARSFFVKRELAAITRLTDFDYNVQMICHFSCMDDKNRWNQSYENQSLQFCNNKTDNLHFIVYEYIEEGDVGNYLRKATLKEAASLLFQISMTLMIMAYTHHVFHGDLNTGNILLRKTEKTKTMYTVRDNSVFIQTHGFEPVFIDFGLSKIMKPTAEYVMEDVFTAFEKCMNYSPFRDFFQAFLSKQIERNIKSPDKFIKDMKECIQQLPPS